jgi:hypothetical protein
MMRIWSVFACAALLLLAACTSIGPTTIPRDRFDYGGALAESWKNQLLLNLVKLRYLDLPIFLEVGQIVSGYTLESSASIGGQIGNTVAGTNFLELGTTGRYVDRPTITYKPLTGENFLASFLTPIAPAKVLALVQAGFPADFILELTVQELNGLRNRPISLGAKHKADPAFFQVLALLREIQDAGAVGMRVKNPEKEGPATVFFFRRDKVPPDVAAKIIEARALLGLPKNAFDFRIVQSPLPGRAGELSLATRSLMQVLTSLALGVEIPPPHLQRGLTPVAPDLSSEKTGLLRVHSGTDKPGDAFVAVPYEGQWFWVANDDSKSKRTFSSILFLFTLADTGGKEQQPVLTIPTQ